MSLLESGNDWVKSLAGIKGVIHLKIVDAAVCGVIRCYFLIRLIQLVWIRVSVEECGSYFSPKLT